MKDFRIDKNHHHDHLGTTRYITNENGEILHTTDTLAYGEELTAPYENDKDEVLNTITFIGHEKDYETGLTYMLARYYSQGYGRFLSPDPGYDYDQLDPMSWNLYSYVRGNPVKNIDKTGKWTDIAMHAAVYQEKMNEALRKAENSPKPPLSPAGQRVEAAFQATGGLIISAIALTLAAPVVGAVAESGAPIVLGEQAAKKITQEAVTKTILATGYSALAEETVSGLISGKDGGEIVKEQAKTCGFVLVTGGNSKLAGTLGTAFDFATSSDKGKTATQKAIGFGFTLITGHDADDVPGMKFTFDVINKVGTEVVTEKIFKPHKKEKKEKEEM